eukprot:7989396-Pyramimonas_sp.AAC.1
MNAWGSLGALSGLFWAAWRLPWGGPAGPSSGSRAPVGCVLRCPGAVWGRLGGPSAPPDALLGSSWVVLGSSG